MKTGSVPEAFGFSEWPFRVVASADFAKVWADRTTLRSDIDRRLSRLSIIAHSSIQLMWADFGAGKTHALRYMNESAMSNEGLRLLPVYTETPVAVSGFSDLYRQFVKALPAATWSLCLQKLAQAPTASIGAQDFGQAVRLLSGGDATSQRVARAWLLAEPGFPSVKELRSYGISSRIESDERAIEVVTALVNLLNLSGSSLLWLIDEFQRTATIIQRKRDVLARSIVTLFNESSQGLHFVISSSVAQQVAATALLPEDLRSRAGTFPLLAVPHMTTEDCRTFCCDLFRAFRMGSHSDEYPFSKEGLETAISLIQQRSASPVTPRSLMQGVEGLLLSAYDTGKFTRLSALTSTDVSELWAAAQSEP